MFHRLGSKLRRHRQWIRNHPASGYVLAAAIFLAAGVTLWRWLAPPEPYRDVSLLWYYDLNTKKPFHVRWGEHRELPPQPAPSGPLDQDQGPFKKGEPAGARLHRFACGSCAASQFDGFLEMYTPAMRAAQIDHIVSPDEVLRNWFVRKLDDEAWVPHSEPLASDIVFGPALRCKTQSKRLVQCEVRETR